MSSRSNGSKNFKTIVNVTSLAFTHSLNYTLRLEQKLKDEHGAKRFTTITKLLMLRKVL